MSPRRNDSDKNGQMPVPRGGQDDSGPSGRIELGGPPEIDITNDQIGLLFTERRRALGLKIDEVAEDIKIKSEYLRAIEREDFEALPTPQYARLFIRAYAERLGFNTSEVYALLDINVPDLAISGKNKPVVAPSREASLAGPLPGTQATLPKDAKKAGKSTVIWWALGVTVVALAIITFIILKMEEPAETGDTQPFDTPAEEVAPPPAVPDVVEEPVTEPLAADSGLFRLTLRFGKDTWASLMADGETVERNTFLAGTELTATADESFRLSLAHTDQVEAFVDGLPLQPFGQWTDSLVGHLITRDSVAKWQDTTRAATAAQE
jgi:cytoskeletal protein RodZ